MAGAGWLAQDQLAAKWHGSARQGAQPDGALGANPVVVQIDQHGLRPVRPAGRPGAGQIARDRRVAQHRRHRQDPAEDGGVSEADLEGADAAERGTGNRPAAPVRPGQVALVDDRHHLLGDERAIGGTLGIRSTRPSHRHQIVVAKAIIGGDADNDRRRQQAGLHRVVQLAIEPPAAIPALAPGEVQGNRRRQLRRQRIPVEQILAVVEIDDRIATLIAAIAGRQVDQEPLLASECSRLERQAVEPLGRCGAIRRNRRRAIHAARQQTGCRQASPAQPNGAAPDHAGLPSCAAEPPFYSAPLARATRDRAAPPSPSRVKE